MKLIDIGVNFTGSSFRKDLPQTIERAIDAGVTKMIVTGTNIEHSEAAIKLTEDYPDILYATVGVHPHHAKECDDSTINILEEMAQHPNVVAIGECGLDFNRNFSPEDVQLKYFEMQLELASSVQLPVFLHQRDAHADFIKILKPMRSQLVNAVAHCFTGNSNEVKDYIDMDMHIGITGWICDERRGQSLQQAVKFIPQNRLMIETDAPYLLPRDIKTRDLIPKPKDNRNEPAYLPHICRTTARHRGEDADQLAAATIETTMAFFNIPK